MHSYRAGDNPRGVFIRDLFITTLYITRNRNRNIVEKLFVSRTVIKKSLASRIELFKPPDGHISYIILWLVYLHRIQITRNMIHLDVIFCILLVAFTFIINNYINDTHRALVQAHTVHYTSR